MPGSEHPPVNWPGWPEGKKFAVVLTHDVEKAVGLHKCRDLMRLDLKAGFRSSFNFVPEGDYRAPRELREELVAHGFEVGLHDLRHDGRLYQSRREFNQRAVRINHYLSEWDVAGFRSAFMLHKLDWLHELNISYDASTFDTDPFEPQPEGRHTIFPFWVDRPAPLNGQCSSRDHSRSGYVELPYTLPQDSTLFLLLGEKSPDIWLRKLDWIAEHGGMVLLDTHPDYMSFDRSGPKQGQYPSDFYEQFLTQLKARYSGLYWNALPREVAVYVSETNKVKSESGTAGEKSPVAVNLSNGSHHDGAHLRTDKRWRVRGKHAAVVLFSYYPADPRPRRAAEALAREGVTIDFVCLQKDKSEPRRETVNGIHVVRMPVQRQRGGRVRYARQYSVFILRSFVYLAARCLVRRYDFVHVHNMPDVLVFSALVPKMLGAKIILDLHDPVPELMQTIFEVPEESGTVRMLKRFEKWSIGFADVVLTVNLACKRIYSSRSCSPDKITVVLNSPEDDIFRIQAPSLNGRKSAEPFVIMYHGSLVHRNGFDLAVDALEKVRQSIPTARLLVCGERTSFFQQTMDSAAKRGLADYIDYVGVKSRAGVVEAINSSHLGVIPNHRNIFTEINTPTRIFEYLALGKPVIAPKAQGIRDYFGEDDLIYFELGDADDLARQINFAYSYPVETNDIVARGQKIYQAHQWSHQRLNLLDAIGSVL